MVFSGLTFLLLFLPVVLLLYYIAPGLRWRNGVLIVASLLFYGWGEPLWVTAMVFSTLVNYLCGLKIAALPDGGRKKLCLTAGVLVSLGFLFYFKYAAFFIRTLIGLGLPLTEREIRLPIGISFYTFQVLTYTVDVYRGKVPVQRSFWRLLLYVSCFPQLIAGPIVQYGDVYEALEERTVSPEDFSDGFGRFVTGLAKKVLLANICGKAFSATALGGTGASMSLLGSWYSAILYSLQIYFDFSAYSDMAIGMGRMLGFRYLENFDYPYTSASVTEFWRRWHISLGSFFREYVYIPLGGNRRGTLITLRNLLLVWMLTGFWHGADWNFILWGLYFGVLLIIERVLEKPLLRHIPAPVRRVVTFLLVVISWMIFYYTDLAACREHLLALFSVGETDGVRTLLPLMDSQTMGVIRQYTFFPLLALILSLPVVPRCRERLCERPGGERLCRVLGWGAEVVLLALSVIFIIGQSYNPFIYFRF